MPLIILGNGNSILQCRCAVPEARCLCCISNAWHSHKARSLVQAELQAEAALQVCKPVSFLPVLAGLVCLLCSLLVGLLSIFSSQHPVKAIIKQSLTLILKLVSVLAWVCPKAARLAPRTLCLLISLQKAMTTASDTKAGPAQLLCSG